MNLFNLKDSYISSTTFYGRLEANSGVENGQNGDDEEEGNCIDTPYNCAATDS